MAESNSNQPVTFEAVNAVSARLWTVHNIIAFMAEALDCDAPGALPIKCTLNDLRDMTSSLAGDIMNMGHDLERAEWSARKSEASHA